MLLAFVSAGAGSALTFAVILQYLNYLRRSGSTTGDPKLKMLMIAMYGIAIMLSLIAVWLTNFT